MHIDADNKRFQDFIAETEKKLDMEITVEKCPSNADNRQAKISTILASGDKNIDLISVNDEMISEFEFNDHISMEINGKMFYFTHGHKYNIEKIPYDDFDVMMYGHIHQGFIEEKEGLVFANPGSISLPKGGSRHSYIVVDGDGIWLKDVEGDKIKEYVLK